MGTGAPGPPKLGRELDRGVETLGRVFFETAQNDAVEPDRDVGAKRPGWAGGSILCLIATATGVWPVNGSLPVNISKRTTPSE